MRNILKALSGLTLLCVPSLIEMYQTGIPEYDGVIKLEDGNYRFYSLRIEYQDQESKKYGYFSYLNFYIDLPGQVKDYFIDHADGATFFFEDGSAMYLTKHYRGGYHLESLVHGAVKQYSKEEILKKLEEPYYAYTIDDMMEHRFDPEKYIAPYEAYYRANANFKAIREEMNREDYDKMNFYVELQGVWFWCYNVPKDLFQRYLKSIGSVHVIEPDKYEPQKYPQKVSQEETKKEARL